LLLEPENGAALVAEITLVLVATCEAIAEAGEHEIELCGPDSNRFGNRNINASAQDEREGIIAWVRRSGARVLASLCQICESIGMGTAEHRFHKGLEMLRAVFQNGAYIVGEKIATSRNDASRRARTVRCCRKSKGFREAAVTLEFTLDSEEVVDIDDGSPAPSVHAKAADDVAVFRVEPHEGVDQGNFYVGVILCECGGAERKKHSQKNYTSNIDYVVSHFGFMFRLSGSDLPASNCP
jgi:hypothetical protein